MWCHLHIWSYGYFFWKFWFQLVFHPAQHFTWCTLNMLNKQDDNIQPWQTPFFVLNQSVVSYPVLTVGSWSACRFLRRQVKCSYLLKNFPQFVVMHTVKGFSIVIEAEVDVFLEFSCFFYDSTDVGNLISGSSAFSKSSLNIWEFLGHILLKPSTETF